MKNYLGREILVNIIYCSSRKKNAAGDFMVACPSEVHRPFFPWKRQTGCCVPFSFVQDHLQRINFKQNYLN